MTKHFRPQHAPRPTKGTLTTLAKKQVQANEAKAAELQQEREADQARGDDAAYDKGPPLPPVDESKFETKLPEAIVNDAAAGSEHTGVPQTPEQPSAPAAASPEPAPPAPTPAVVKTPKGTTDGQYTLGKRYSPKTDRNSETWGKICKALADGPKTMKELAEAVKGHGDFLGYMTRGGHIVPHKVEEKVSG